METNYYEEFRNSRPRFLDRDSDIGSQYLGLCDSGAYDDEKLGGGELELGVYSGRVAGDQRFLGHMGLEIRGFRRRPDVLDFRYHKLDAWPKRKQEHLYKQGR